MVNREIWTREMWDRQLTYNQQEGSQQPKHRTSINFRSVISWGTSYLTSILDYTTQN